MMRDILNLQEWALKNDRSIIIELNDFINGNLHLHDEISDLLNENSISQIEAAPMLLNKTIWSVRSPIPDTDDVDIAYSDSLQKAIDKFNQLPHEE